MVFAMHRGTVVCQASGKLESTASHGAGMHHLALSQLPASLAGWFGGAPRLPAGEREGASGPAGEKVLCHAA